jgi:hypothetical protein
LLDLADRTCPEARDLFALSPDLKILNPASLLKIVTSA